MDLYIQIIVVACLTGMTSLLAHLIRPTVNVFYYQ